ncbi:MAG TPA: glycosyltransferase family 1 protein [Candidatus Paceibacterota bacterium]
MSGKIAINLLSISPQNPTGSFVYIKNLLGELVVLDRDNIYYLILDHANRFYFKNELKNYSNVKYHIVSVRRDLLLNPHRALLKLWTKTKKDYRWRESVIRGEIQHFLDKNKVDVIFFPSGTIYPVDLKNVKTITTVFDLQHEYFPNNFSNVYLARRKTASTYVAHNSDRIIAISEFTKQSIVEKYGINPDKITVIYLASHKEKDGRSSLSSLPDNFIFYPAAIWPHKNHRILIEAMNVLKFKFPDLHLVFTGVTKNKELKDELCTLTAVYGLTGRVNFLGFVSDEDVLLIYKRAKALVYPSSFEGFGIPLVEAFKFGTPVIAANNSSIGEVVGDAGILFETNDLEMLTKNIEQILSDDLLRNDLIKRGRERAKDFSWDASAQKTLDIFNSLC